MVRRSQTGILGIVILTAILLGIISVTFLWGQPLIQKSVDKANTNMLLNKLYELNDAVLYTASTGSNSIIRLDLSQSTFIIDDDNNRIVFETYSTVPIIASIQEVPINYYELANVRESITYNASSTSSSDPQITGYELVTHHTNTTIGGEFYNVSIHENSTSNEWEILCIWKDYTITMSSDCAEPGEAVVKTGTTIDVLSIITGGEGAYVLGDYIDNIGVLGSEPSGIISAQSISLKDREKITYYLTYRPMMSAFNEEYLILINCSQNCVSSDSGKELIIMRDSIVRSRGSVTTKINMEIR